MRGNSIITLKKDAISNNIKFLKSKLGEKVKISSVVKANAYGHGIEQIVPLFENEGINHFAVFNYNEAVRVQKSLKNEAEIMIMGWIDEKNIEKAIIKGFDFYIFNIERLKIALNFAKSLNIKAKIHIEAETGMNRSGLNTEELTQTINIIKENEESFEIKGFCTHLAGAESISNHVRIQNQIKKFNKLYTQLTEKGIYPKYKHAANSAAAFVYPKTRMDLVRIGIMQYGFWSSAETFIHYSRNKKSKTNPLKRILSWESKVMAVKDIKTGEFVGYGTSFLTQVDMRTALIPIGYSGGYSRSLSNRGRVLINGQRCGVIGTVNMNMIIADITAIPEVKVGDKVIIIGKQGDLEIKVSAFSNISDKLNYEILAHLPKNIKRKII